jgi:ArsR family transcriptional regulator
VVLDLQRHNFEEARDLYADLWLGFGQAELARMASDAGFIDFEVATVHREADAPYLETLLAIARKA